MDAVIEEPLFMTGTNEMAEYRDGITLEKKNGIYVLTRIERDPNGEMTRYGTTIIGEEELPSYLVRHGIKIKHFPGGFLSRLECLWNAGKYRIDDYLKRLDSGSDQI